MELSGSLSSSLEILSKHSYIFSESRQVFCRLQLIFSICKGRGQGAEKSCFKRGYILLVENESKKEVQTRNSVDAKSKKHCLPYRNRPITFCMAVKRRVLRTEKLKLSYKQLVAGNCSPVYSRGTCRLITTARFARIPRTLH